MQFRKDIKSGNDLSILGFGCMRFPKRGNNIDIEKSEELILKALDYGINYFDTAYIYSGIEEALGTIIQKNNIRDKMYIADKLPTFLIKGKNDFDKYFDRMLERLKTDYIDYFLMHMLPDLAMWQKLCSWGIEDWIKEKKQSGAIKQIGFSFHGKKDEFIKIIDAYDWEFCMIQYNYSDENYQAGVGGLKHAASKGIPVMIMEPLLGGRLINGLPQDAKDLFNKADPSLSPAAWGLKWVWNQSEVCVVLSGMNAIEQLEDNVKTAEDSVIGMFSEKENELFKQVRDVFGKAYKVKCTGCNYCMPCPQNVNIPGCFAAYNTSFYAGHRTGMQQYMQSTSAASKSSGAGLCVRCGKCEKHCPQGIKIMDTLVDVKKRMEPLWYRAILKFWHMFLLKDK